MGLRLFTDNFTAPFQLHLAICSHMHKQWIPGHSFGGGGGGGGGWPGDEATSSTGHTHSKESTLQGVWPEDKGMGWGWRGGAWE